jgi:hypothetical protein
MTKPTKPAIIFVYNADSGAFNLLSDMARKLFSPQTYACHLCAITHSNFAMKKEWKAFLETLDASLEFLHADEFKNKYSFEKAELPAIFSNKNGVLNLMVGTDEINNCQNLEDLKKLINLNKL